MRTSKSSAKKPNRCEMKTKLNPVHPGDVLREDFMKPLEMSAYAMAKAIAHQ